MVGEHSFYPCEDSYGCVSLKTTLPAQTTRWLISYRAVIKVRNGPPAQGS